MPCTIFFVDPHTECNGGYHHLRFTRLPSRERALSILYPHTRMKMSSGDAGTDETGSDLFASRPLRAVHYTAAPGMIGVNKGYYVP